MGTIEDSNPPEAKVVGNYSDPLAKSPQPTAQEAERADEVRGWMEWWDQEGRYIDSKDQVVEAYAGGYRRGRAEGERNAAHEMLDLFRARMDERDQMKDKLAAAEQENARLREALEEARTVVANLALEIVKANLPSPTMERHEGVGVRMDTALAEGEGK